MEDCIFKTRRKQLASFAASETDLLRRFALVNGTSATWLDAQAHCKENYTDLARVQNQQENEQLQTMLREKKVWFGLRLQYWKWSDGSRPSFQPWKSHQYPQGSGECAALDLRSRFNGLINLNCAKNASFFCYSGKHVDLLELFYICQH